MKPLVTADLVNPPTGDAALYLEFLFERRALLFDIGEIHRLPNRKILRITDVFVSHTHMDHFAGLDRVLRICLGRDRRIRLYGPPGFIDRVEHKLQAYTWNLLYNSPSDFTLCALEVNGDGWARQAEFHARRGFCREGESERPIEDGVLLQEAAFSVRFVSLDHRIPSLAFALEEGRHINVWKNRLVELGLPTGPWLGRLKRAVLEARPPSTPIETDDGRLFPLGELQAQLLRIVPGQKLAYVTDAAGHERNARRIRDLAAGADILFIETPFLDRDRPVAAAKHHLTARRAGEIGRRAGVKRLVPFHFSARYAGCENALEEEAQAALQGTL